MNTLFTTTRRAVLALGAAALAFLALPLAKLCEHRLSRSAASLCALAGLAAALSAAAALMIPRLFRQLTGLAAALPRSLSTVEVWIHLAAKRLPWLPSVLPDLSALNGLAPKLAAQALALAAHAADAAGRLSMMAILAFFFLRDREALLLRLELLVPRAARPAAVRMGNAVSRELRLYLRAQLRIALSVAALAAAGLALVRVRGALTLGLMIGVMNMVPYFGPLIGGAPAVLIALGDGFGKAALTLAALCLVQQADGAIISPRVMGSVTGLPPALVLVALFAGAELAGIAGMLFAVPALIIFRTLYRVYVQRRENI